jgi:hypothetical protein
MISISTGGNVAPRRAVTTVVVLRSASSAPKFTHCVVLTEFIKGYAKKKVTLLRF